MARRQVWISDNSNPKYQKIKGSFLQAMHEQTKEPRINYYDFLLVAKKLNFRFEESSHLMALKNYFAKNKNSVLVKKMADLLCVQQESLHAQEEKIIVKYTVPDTEFAPIKEETHEDQEFDEVDVEDEYGKSIFQKLGNSISHEEERQINQKMAIILSIKVDEMEKKLKCLTNEKQKVSLLSLMEEQGLVEFNYEQFKHLIVSLLAEVREKIKISEDDIKTLFFILDHSKYGTITQDNIKELKNLNNISMRLKEFYKSRINKDMVKNTLFKLGKVKNNSIQIYQVKNASLLQFENIEKSILLEKQHFKALNRLKPAKIPHFGPLKGATLPNRQHNAHFGRYNQSGKGFQSQIRFQRDKIQKILKLSKQDKRKEKKGETVASKLRSLFIHKVILPRQKMLEQERERYLRHKAVENDLFIKSTK